MYTVVIPTLWIPDSTKFKGLVEELVVNTLASKVVIIDNDPKVDESLRLFILGNSPKIVHLRMKKNTYVNPAWNLGVSRWSTTINSNPTELNLIMEKDREQYEKLSYK